MYFSYLKSGSGFSLRQLSNGNTEHRAGLKCGNCQVVSVFFGQRDADYFLTRALSEETALKNRSADRRQRFENAESISNRNSKHYAG
jgi:hypothetical protein